MTPPAPRIVFAGSDVNGRAEAVGQRCRAVDSGGIVEAELEIAGGVVVEGVAGQEDQIEWRREGIQDVTRFEQPLFGPEDGFVFGVVRGSLT